MAWVADVSGRRGTGSGAAKVRERLLKAAELYTGFSRYCITSSYYAQAPYAAGLLNIHCAAKESTDFLLRAASDLEDGVDALRFRHCLHMSACSCTLAPTHARRRAGLGTRRDARQIAWKQSTRQMHRTRYHNGVAMHARLWICYSESKHAPTRRIPTGQEAVAAEGLHATLWANMASDTFTIASGTTPLVGQQAVKSRSTHATAASS